MHADHPLTPGSTQPDPNTVPSPLTLVALGWDDNHARHFQPHAQRGLTPARVAIGHRAGYHLYTATGEIEAQLAGSLRHAATGPAEFPVVGNWVAIRHTPPDPLAIIHAVLARRTVFARQAPGRAAEQQLLAANVDTVLLVSGLDGDFNPRRLERYLILAWESGAQPVVVLTKADRVRQVEAIAPGVPVHAISSLHPDGPASLAPYLQPGHTLALLGSSGAGKSTLVNRLAGRDLQCTAEVRASDSRGRHTTTTHRELILLPGGALIIDTPGLREIQLWAADSGHDTAFDDIQQLAQRCRFLDCTHQTEPRCAVRQAIAAGTLPPDRLASYLKLARELRHLDLRLDHHAQCAQKQQYQAIHKQMRNFRPRG